MPPRSEAPPTSSIEQFGRIRRRVLTDMIRIIALYEPLYADSSEHILSTKERYAHFERWMEEVIESDMLPVGYEGSQVKLSSDLSHAVKLYEALRALKEGRPLAREIQKEYQDAPLAPDECILSRQDIPTWNELPSEQDLKTTFNFDWIWTDEYKEGRKLNDPNDAQYTTNGTLRDRKGFVPTDQDLLNVKYGMDNQGIDHPEKRQAFLQSVDLDHLPETLLPAKIFEIGDIIAQKKAENTNHPDYLTTQELLEAFDEAGVRPATLTELLAYGKKYWKPKPDPSKPLSPEEKLQHASAPHIYAVGSVFSLSGGNRRVPYLDWFGGRRRLGAIDVVSDWRSSDRFLVFRKESS